MVESTLPLPGLSPVAGKDLVATFDGGRLSSDGGLLMLREVEGRLHIADRLAACITDRRHRDQTVHTLAAIIRFRLLAIAAGYEDGNDASGSALTNDSAEFANMRLSADEKRCRGSTLSGSSRATGSGHRVAQQRAETCLAGADRAAERGRGRHDGDPAADRQRQTDDLALAGALHDSRGRWPPT